MWWNTWPKRAESAEKMASLQQQQQNASGSDNLAQDPLTYQKLQEAFIKDLRHFHDTKG